MTELDFETSQLQFLTDALRAGPGSPEWRAALASIEQGGGGGADEYKMLYTARERLASGQKYREVRAGSGFTRKVFDSLDREESGVRRPLLSANLIAAISALAILAILGVVTYFIMPTASAPPPELAQTYFVNTLSQSDFETELGMEWAPFGALGIQARHGLRPSPLALGPEFKGGGVFYEKSLPVTQTFALEAAVLVPRSGDHFAIQLFVTDDPNFAGDSATSEHELVCLLRGGQASVILPGGHVERQNIAIANRSPVDVRIAIAGNEAAIEIAGKRVWSGKHQLAGDKPRLAGVRFLARAGANEKDAVPVVQSVRVLVPQK